MFNNYDCVTLVNKLAENIEEHSHILEMQSCGRLIKYVKGPSRITSGKLGGELHPLSLSS